MFFSPDAKGEYLYGSGQDAINWAWAAVHGAICQFVNDETLGEPESFDRFVQGVTNGQTATMYETHCVEYQGEGGYALGAGFGRGTTYVVSVYEIAGGIGGDIAAGGELVISFGALGEVAIPQAAIGTAVVAHGGWCLFGI